VAENERESMESTAEEAPTEEAAASEEAVEEGTEAAAEGDEPVEDEGLESEGEDLFAEPDEDELFAESADEDLFEEEEASEQKPVSHKSFRKRVGKLTAQREEARREAAKAREELAEARGRLEAIQQEYETTRELARVFQEKYGKFQDPAKQALWDSSFMEAAEELAKTNPEVRAAVNAVADHVSGGKVMNTGREAAPTREPEKKAEAEAPKPDPRVEAIVRQNAQRTVHDALGAVKPAFRDVIADHIVNRPDVDLTTLDASAVKKIAGAYIREKGFTREEVLAKPGKAVKAETPSAKEEPKKAPTASGKGTAVAPSLKKAPEGSGEKPEPPKSRSEWEARRNERLEAFFQEVGSG